MSRSAPDAFTSPSQQVLDEDAAARAARRLAEVEALSGIGSWEWEIATDTLRWSEQLSRIYGVESGSGLGYGDFIGRVHPDDRDEVEGIVRRALEDRRPFEIEHRIVLDDGVERHVHSRGYVLLDADGAPIGMLGSAQDVTDARAAEAMRVAEGRRAAAEQARDDALALIAHDLRSPLAVVVGYVQLLQRQAADRAIDTDKLTPYLERVDAAARQMNALLEDLLVDASPEATSEPLEREPLDLVEHLRATAEHHDAISASHAVSVRLPDHPVVASVNLPKLERALHNLLLNAIKYSPKGGEILLALDAAEDKLRISVRDHGMGIPADDLPLIFDRFHRGANASGRTSGLGLGLTSAARAVEAHGGRIEVTSVDGEGSTFTIHLPREE